MAFPLPPTLNEIRQATAVRLNFGPQAQQGDAMRDLLTEFVQRASRELYVYARWVELRVRYDISLVNAQSAYDWPDNMDPSRLERLMVLDNDGYEFELAADIRPSERSEYTDGDNPEDLPLRYEIVNKELRIYPPPDTTEYPTLRIEGFERPTLPRNNNDRIPMDREALIQRATLIGKLHFGHEDAGRAEAMHKDYLERIKPVQAAAATLQVGGRARKIRHGRLGFGRDGYFYAGR